MKTKWLKKPPPPKDRPKCPWCGKPLRPWVSDDRKIGHRDEPIEKTWLENLGSGYRGYGVFDTLTCAAAFANAAYQAGFRKVQK